jgi:head-tail adaptor
VLSNANAEVSVFVRQQSRDVSGALITKWACSAHKAACYIQTNTAAENVRAGGERSVFAGIAEFPIYIDVTQGDRLVWDTRTLQVDASHRVYRNGDFADRYRVEWSEVRNAGA